MTHANPALSRARMAAVSAALMDEIQRFLAAVRAGAQPMLQTAFGPYVVTSINKMLEATAHPSGKRADWANTRTFHLANDARWADLLRQVGVARNPLFTDHTPT